MLLTSFDLEAQGFSEGDFLGKKLERKRACTRCKCWVNPDNHEQNCGSRAMARQKEVTLAIAWVGDALLTFDVRRVLLLRGYRDTSLASYFVNNDFLARFLKESGRAPSDLTTREAADLFESQYYIDKGLREEFLKKVASENLDPVMLSVSRRIPGVGFNKLTSEEIEAVRGLID